MTATRPSSPSVAERDAVRFAAAAIGYNLWLVALSMVIAVVAVL
ncbi:MHYT domain-containing protein [Nocardia gipuzkoensis]